MTAKMKSVACPKCGARVMRFDVRMAWTHCREQLYAIAPKRKP